MLPLLAQGIDSVPAEFLKHLVTVILAGVTAYLGFLKGRRGRSDDPVHLAQPVQVKQAIEHASKEEMQRIEKRADKTDAKLDELREKLLKAGDEREGRLSKGIKDEVSKLRAEHAETVRSIRQEIQDARDQALKAQLSAASHAAQIEDLQSRDHHHDTQLSVLLQRPQCGKCGKPH